MLKNKHKLTLLIATIFICGAIGLVAWNETKQPAPTFSSYERIDDLPLTSTYGRVADPSPTNTPTDTNVTPPSSYTLTDLAAHSDATSCWVAVDDVVYDLTTYINKHPGGSRSILSVCGQDGSRSFNSMPSSVIATAKAVMKKYQLGTLK